MRVFDIFPFNIVSFLFFHAKTVLVLTAELTWKLFHGTARWAIMLFRLLLFILVLLYPFTLMIYRYVTDPRIVKNVSYSVFKSKRRHLLDIYLPVVPDKKKVLRFFLFFFSVCSL